MSTLVKKSGGKLCNLTHATHTGKRGLASQLQRSIERINELPKPKQRFVIEMLETVLAQASR